MHVLAASALEDLFRAFLQGLPPGTVYALFALGFVLTYKTSGVFNLAFGAQAYVSAAMFFKAREQWGWEIPPALVLSVFILAPLVGLLLEGVIFRHLRTAGDLPKLVVTIGLAVALPNLFNVLASFEPTPGVTPAGIVPDGATVFYDPFGVYPFSRDELVAVAVAVVAMTALAGLFRFTAIGLRMRAVVESPRMTELNGIPADRISAVAWMLSSFFAGIAGVLIAPRFNTLAPGDFFGLMVIAIAAASVGKLASLPGALVGGLGLGVFIAEANTFLPRWAESSSWLEPLQDNLTPAIPFMVLFGILVLVPGIRRAKAATDPLAGVDPPPPSIGMVERSRRDVLLSRVAGTVFVVGVLAIVLTQGDQVWVFRITEAVALATIFLSITVITGLGGQISLCQGAFAATGAFAVFQLVDRYDMGAIPAALVGAVIAAALGALLSLPVRRLGGVWVAIATLAFAYFFDSVVLQLPFVGGGDTSLFQGTAVPRPVVGPWDLGSDKSFLVFAVVVLAIVAVLVVNLRSGTLGKTLLAIRGSEVAAQSVGISPGRARLVAFAVSAFIAAIGGSLMAMHQENVNYGNNFEPFLAVFWLVLVAVLGVRTVSGAIQGAVAFTLFDPLILKGELLGWILRSPESVPGVFPIVSTWVFILFGFGAIQFARHPQGILEYQLHRRAVKAAEKRDGPGPGPPDGSSTGAEVDERTEEPVG
ncbi:MAG: ABC transporter permease [Acidimicrobiales bacterium]|nr:ABC transporter permease [Acidimicrobiales bacterium]